LHQHERQAAAADGESDVLDKGRPHDLTQGRAERHPRGNLPPSGHGTNKKQICEIRQYHSEDQAGHHE